MHRIALCLLLALLALPALAQSDDVSTSIRNLAPGEEARMRATLAEPAPQNAGNAELLNYFKQKQFAADRLGDSDAVLAVFREWEATMPSTLALNNYILELRRAGLAQEALKKREEQLRTVGNGVFGQMFRNNYVGELMDLGRFEDAQRELTAVSATVAVLKGKPLQDWALVYLNRVQAEVLLNTSRMNTRYGKLEAAMDSARQAVGWAQEGLRLAQRTPDRNGRTSTIELPHAAGTLSMVLNRRVQTCLEAGQYEEAEQALRELLQLAKSGLIHPKAVPGIYISAGNLRFELHEFALAESYFLKADAIALAQGLGEAAPLRVNLARLRLLSLEGQRRSPEVLSELARLDTLAKTDAALARKLRFAFERGYGYLLAKTRATEAARLFADISANLEKQYSEHHFYIARAHGLQGVALWRTAIPQNREQALGLLDEAVRDYMRHDNLAFETRGVNKDMRDLIFATYLEAQFSSAGGHPMEAMVPADWVRGGSVQEALTDAAVRSAAATPALTDLVRAEQDARHETEALRKLLAGEADSETAPAAEIARTMRARIEELSATRRKLQADIQARFPDYDRLVRPQPPRTAELARALAADEALVMLLPTEDATYVWALNHDGAASAVRVDMPLAELNALVTSLRQTLDFAKMGRRLAPFNASASSTLYQKLMAPLQSALSGKNHLVVAAGGALGQIPFGVLLTQPTSHSSASSPWLIRQAAITHVPSLSAWLALKQYAHSAPAPEALIAWGDPLFASGRGASGAQGDGRNVVLSRQAAADMDKGPAQSALRYSDIPALPETRDELLAIAATLQANPARDLHLGEQATKASVLQSSQSGELQKKKVIAFATHGLMAGDLPHLTQPALALASTGLENQDPLGALLTLDEVLNLRLNADWVILSACNTAAADGREEEALSGLARGFFYAGSRSLLVTHWAVESASAMQLTTRTMASYAAHPAERKSESLRQAMLSVMATPSYAHPAYWAPYSLVGEGGR